MPSWIAGDGREIDNIGFFRKPLPSKDNDTPRQMIKKERYV